MNTLKKTLALVAALAMTTTAFVGCEKDGESGKDGDTTTAKPAETTKAPDDSNPDEKPEIKLPTNGKTLTVMSWNDEFPKMVENYYIKDNPLPDGVTYNPVSFGVGGGGASEKYDPYFTSGEDIDIFCLEADFALKYMESDTYVAPLSDVGLTKADFSKNYEYTLEIGTSNGVLKGVSFQAAPGGYVYRKDLAESYLGATTPEEMQAFVKDWDTFKASAKTVLEKSGDKKTAMAATVGGIWQVFATARSSSWVVDGALNVDKDVTDFLSFAKELADAGYVNKDIDQWAQDGSWHQLGQTDQVMGYFVSTWGLKDNEGKDNGADGFMTQAAGSKGGATYGKWNITEGPQAYFWGGTWLVVNPNCDNADLAAEVIKYFCSTDESMKKYATATGDFVNNKDVMKQLVEEKTNANGNLGGQDQFQVLNKVAANLDMDSSLITKYDSAIKGEFMTACADYLDGKTASVDDAVKAFKESVAAKVSGINVK